MSFLGFCGHNLNYKNIQLVRRMSVKTTQTLENAPKKQLREDFKYFDKVL